jgi:hypothetical protein
MNLSEYCEKWKVAYLEVVSLMSFEREAFGSIDNYGF